MENKGKKSIYDIIRQDGIYVATIKNPNYKAKLTKQDNDSIGWASYSWNPITGCKFNCDYCYAKQMTSRNGNIYPNGFEPTFYPHKLNIPSNTKHDDKLPNNRVFVCSMADLFGSWIPDEYIWKIINVCKKELDFTYMFLTKNPDRYMDFEFTNNCWLGATATNQRQYDRAIKNFKLLKNQEGISNKLYLSIEPFKEQINCYDGLDYVDLVLIGGESKGSHYPMELQPQQEWLDSLIDDCKKSNCEYWLKSNLRIIPTIEKIDYQNTVLTNFNQIKTALKEVKSYSLDRIGSKNFKNIAQARLISSNGMNEIYIINFYKHFPKRDMAHCFNVMNLNYEFAEFGDQDLSYLAEFGWYYDDAWTPQPIEETMAYKNMKSYLKHCSYCNKDFKHYGFEKKSAFSYCSNKCHESMDNFYNKLRA